jgi:hypothetical protein
MKKMQEKSKEIQIYKANHKLSLKPSHRGILAMVKMSVNCDLRGNRSGVSL